MYKYVYIYICTSIYIHVCVYVCVPRVYYGKEYTKHIMATHTCNTLQHTATHCNTLQHTFDISWQHIHETKPIQDKSAQPYRFVKVTEQHIHETYCESRLGDFHEPVRVVGRACLQ